ADHQSRSPFGATLLPPRSAGQGARTGALLSLRPDGPIADRIVARADRVVRRCIRVVTLVGAGVEHARRLRRPTRVRIDRLAAAWLAVVLDEHLHAAPLERRRRAGGPLEAVLDRCPVSVDA